MKVMLFRAQEMSLTSYAGYQWALSHMRTHFPELEVVEIDSDAEPELTRFYGLAPGRLPALVYDHQASYASYLAVDDDLALHDVERWLRSLIGRSNADAEHHQANIERAGRQMLLAIEAMDRLGDQAIQPSPGLRAELAACLAPSLTPAL